MKQPKKLTRQQKECLSAHHLNAENWALVQETDFYLKIINKRTGNIKNVDKFRRIRKGERKYAGRNDCSSNLEGLLEDCNLEIIWDRKETKRMTAEAMRQKLEELTGEKIEVEPSREEMIGACYEFCNKRKCLSTCALRDSGTCTFRNYSDEQLKECYEKAMKDERKES